ncbi:restriction endonuclease subunit S [Halococcus sp. AFM35]|uniref:restriction endonuclease subunit S n=1 Tax=Halococcus sp. AFM35 TaxID=3421653 RepID=UPI003EBFE513
MSEEATLDEFESGGTEDTSNRERDAAGLEQEQFGPFTLSAPGDWTAKRLGDIKRLITRGKQPTYDDNGVPVINQECIYWDGWHFENLRYLNEEVAEGWKGKYFPQSGDIILNSTGQGTLGRAQVYPDNERRAIDSHVTLLRTDEELNPHFHRYFLESYLGQALLYSMCVNGSTGQIELSKTRLDLLPVPLPPREEQRKIATVLYTVDQAIQKTEEIIEQTHVVKNALMQDVFHGRHEDFETYESTPVGEIPSHWDNVSIGDVVHTAQYGISESLSEEGQYPIFRMNNMENGYMIEEPMKYIDLDDDEFEKYRVETGDILFNRTNSLELVGKTGIYELEGDHVFASYLVRLQTNELVDPYYLNYYMNSSEAQNRMMDFATKGVSQANINANSIQQVKLPLPPMDEQKEIAERIDGIDSQIESNQQYKNQLKHLKQGLMQDLLSGAVRTHEADIDIPEAVLAHG